MSKDGSRKKTGCVVALITCGVLLLVALLVTCGAAAAFGVWVTRSAPVDATRTIVSGEEQSYIEMHLEESDEQLLAFMQRILGATNAAAMRQAREARDVPAPVNLYLTFLRKQQRGAIEKMLPIWIELATYEAAPEQGSEPGETNVVAAVTLSKNYRMYQLMFRAASFSLSRQAGVTERVGDAQMIDFSRGETPGAPVIGNLGNTFFVANDPDAMRGALDRYQRAGAGRLPREAAAARARARDGLDVWGFTRSATRLLDGLADAAARAARAKLPDLDPGQAAASAPRDEGAVAPEPLLACRALPPLDLAAVTLDVVSSDTVAFQLSGFPGAGVQETSERPAVYAACFAALVAHVGLDATDPLYDSLPNGGFAVPLEVTGFDRVIGSALDQSNRSGFEEPVRATESSGSAR